MTDNQMQPAPTGVDQAGFLNTSLNAVPRWAAASIGTMLGAAIAIVFVLVIGGMQGPVTRLANAYAAKVEESGNKASGAAERIDQASIRLLHVVERVGHLDATVQAYTTLMRDAVRRLEAIETGINDQSRRLTTLEARMTRLEARPPSVVYRYNVRKD